VLEGEDLPPVAQRVARQQAHLREGVEDHPGGVDALHRLEHRAGGLRQLHLRRVEQRVLGVRLQALLGHLEVADGDPVEVPAVGFRDVAQLLLGLREGGVDPGLSPAGAGQQELHGHGRLPGARVALEKVHPVAGEATPENVVQAFDASLRAIEALKVLRFHERS
jgi:hypothetical protein